MKKCVTELVCLAAGQAFGEDLGNILASPMGVALHFYLHSTHDFLEAMF